MDWVTASLILFGGLSAAMGLGVPVAFAFLMLDVSVRSCSSAARPASRSSRATRLPR